MNADVIRRTVSVCPVCRARLPAALIEDSGAVYLRKECPAHGPFSLKVCCDVAYYRGLNDFYFSLITTGFPQRDYYVELTNRCNLDCPICLAEANRRSGDCECSLERVRAFVIGKKGYKIDLMGAEPTLRDDLPEIIRLIRDSGNIPALHTNGIKLAEPAYLRSLTEAGLAEVHLQFDGFDDRVYEIIRGRKLLAIKLRALENLAACGMATDLVATIVRGVNEGEMSAILAYAARQPFVREVFYLGCRYLGNATRLPLERCMMPDELIAILESQTGGRINRKMIYIFQKLYFTFLYLVSKRKCFYIHHYVVVRDGAGGYIPLDGIYDLPAVHPALDRFRQRAGAWWAVLPLGWALVRACARRRTFRWIGELLTFLAPFVTGFDLSRLSSRTIIVGFISACDRYSYDEQIARNCGKGNIAAVLGIADAAADGAAPLGPAV